MYKLLIKTTLISITAFLVGVVLNSLAVGVECWSPSGCEMDLFTKILFISGRLFLTAIPLLSTLYMLYSVFRNFAKNKIYKTIIFVVGGFIFFLLLQSIFFILLVIR
jgi:hypothetical protein